MAFDAITGIAQAEDAAKVAVSYAQARALQMIEDAKASGAAAVEASIEKAEAELAQLHEKSEEKSEDDVRKLNGKVETKKAVLKAGAEARLDAAVDIIVERIVKD